MATKAKKISVLPLQSTPSLSGYTVYDYNGTYKVSLSTLKSLIGISTPTDDVFYVLRNNSIVEMEDYVLVEVFTGYTGSTETRINTIETDKLDTIVFADYSGITENRISNTENNVTYMSGQTINNITEITGNKDFLNQVKGGDILDSFSSTKVFDMDNGNMQKMIVTGNTTSISLTGKTNGSSYIVILEIGGSGSYTIPQADNTFGTRTDNSVDDSAASWYPTTVGSKILYVINVEPDGDTHYSIETITV